MRTAPRTSWNSWLVCRLSLLLVLWTFQVGLSQDTVKSEILESGMGEPIKMGETAVVAYKLTLENGALMDSKGITNPLSFELGSKDYVPGFSLAVEGMKVGETRLAVIPPSLGYGSQAVGNIPPNSQLRFQIELLQIKKIPPKAEHFEGDGHDHSGEHFEGDGHDHGHDHGEESLSERFQDQDFLKNRNARELSRPAVFEFLLRDFFTKPWRYEDGHIKIWRSVGQLTIVLFLLTGLGAVGRKRGYWS